MATDAQISYLNDLLPKFTFRNRFVSKKGFVILIIINSLNIAEMEVKRASQLIEALRDNSFNTLAKMFPKSMKLVEERFRDEEHKEFIGEIKNAEKRFSQRWLKEHMQEIEAKDLEKEEVVEIVKKYVEISKSRKK